MIIHLNDEERKLIIDLMRKEMIVSLSRGDHVWEKVYRKNLIPLYEAGIHVFMNLLNGGNEFEVKEKELFYLIATVRWFDPKHKLLKKLRNPS